MVLKGTFGARNLLDAVDFDIELDILAELLHVDPVPLQDFRDVA